jgi:hypothetical protein
VAEEPLVEELAAIAASLAGREPSDDAMVHAIRSLSARFDRIVELLAARGVLSPKDVTLLGKLGEAARPRVSLQTYPPKRTVATAPVDCAALIPICRARCCTMRVVLAEEDVREGKVRIDLQDPFVLERGADGYCTHLTGTGCSCYDDRPAICRSYDCREDKRIWDDFERKIPAATPARVRLRDG